MLALLRAITGAQDADAAREAVDKAAESLRSEYPRVAQMLEREGEDILTVYQLPEAHRKRKRSTNPLRRMERLN